MQPFACGYNTTEYPDGAPTYCTLKNVNGYPFQRLDAAPPICIVFGYCDANTTYFTPTWQMAFYTTIDDFTLLQVSNAFGNEVNVTYNSTFNRLGVDIGEIVTLVNRTDAAVQVEMGDKTTGPTPFFMCDVTQQNCQIVPFFTVIVTVNGDQLVSVTWDDAGCFACGGDQCIGNMAPTDPTTTNTSPGFCGINEVDSCASNFTNGGTDCDPKFYVGWYGQDTGGSYLISAGERLSAFRSYSLASAYNSAADTAYAQRPSFPDTTLPTVDCAQTAC